MRAKIIKLFSLTRCRFCGDGMRPKDATNGACHDCAEATFAWLKEMGATITWPMTKVWR